jgi:hypothetical protein
MDFFLKGQYTKVPPRVTFVVQSAGAVIVCDFLSRLFENIIDEIVVVKGRFVELRYHEGYYPVT